MPYHEVGDILAFRKVICQRILHCDEGHVVMGGDTPKPLFDPSPGIGSPGHILSQSDSSRYRLANPSIFSERGVIFC
jgi:hypothetical protein